MRNRSLTFLIAAIIIAVGFTSRLIPHMPNFSPVIALALLAGAYLGRRYWSYLLPLMMLVVTDFVINNTTSRPYFPDHVGTVWIADHMYFTVASLAVIVLVATFLLRRISIVSVLGSVLVGSLLFFLITNFGVWLGSGMYPPTVAGLLECYTAAIPFFRSTLVGNIVFSAVAFGVIEYVVSRQALTSAQA